MTSYLPIPEPAAHDERGFTLVELTVVLLIVSLLVGGLLLPLSVQRDIQRLNETRRQMVDIREALLGFAAAHGRLPCPALSGARGVEDVDHATGQCGNARAFLPAVTLGIAPVDAQGYALDGWGNRIRYAVTQYERSSERVFTHAGGIKRVWQDGSVPQPDLRICSTSAGIGDTDCAAGAELASAAVAVVWSTGGNDVSSGADEQANATSRPNVRTFVSHAPTPADAPQGEFDDILIWLSPHVLYNRMITAGRLP